MVSTQLNIVVKAWPLEPDRLGLNPACVAWTSYWTFFCLFVK